MDAVRGTPTPLVAVPAIAAPTQVTGLARTYAEAVDRGAAVAGAAAQMRADRGFVPDVVFGHTGWGETLFLHEVFPEARHLAYAEFLYRSSGLDTDFDPEFRNPTLASRVAVTARAAHHVQSLLRADAALSPTEWQASTFPPELRPKITVIHDGIDTARVRPDPAAALTLPNGATLGPVPIADTTVSYPGVPPGTYVVTVAAVNAAGSGAPSNPVTVVVP